MSYAAYLAYRSTSANREIVSSMETSLLTRANVAGASSTIRLFHPGGESGGGACDREIDANTLSVSDFLIWFNDGDHDETSTHMRILELWLKDPRRIRRLAVIHLPGPRPVNVSDAGKSPETEAKDLLPERLRPFRHEIPLMEDLRRFPQDRPFNPDDPLLHSALDRLIDLLRNPPLLVNATASPAKRSGNLTGQRVLFFVILTAAIAALLHIYHPLRDSPNTSLSPNGANRANHAAPSFFHAAIQPPLKDFQFMELAMFSPDGSRVLTYCTNRRIQLWSLEGRLITEMKGYDDSVAILSFSPDSAHVLGGSINGDVVLWDSGGQLAARPPRHAASVMTAVFSSDGLRFLTAAFDETAKLWDLRGNLLAVFSKPSGRLAAALLSPGGNSVAGIYRDNSVALWDAQGNLTAELKKHTARVRNAFFSPDGRLLITVSDDKTAKLWDSQGALTAEMNGHNDMVSGAAFSNDGKTFLTYSSDGTVKLWDLQGTLRADLKKPGSRVRSALFSPDGALVLSVFSDASARLWNLRGTVLADLAPADQQIREAIFSPDGKLILTSSVEGAAGLWDLAGRLRSDMRRHAKVILGASFSRNGEHILTYSNDKTAVIWLTPEAAALALKTAPPADHKTETSPNPRPNPGNL